ncbi:hypothetical protein TCON_2586 [Astathelohania contejeani]|uniref:Uncharacterized protein n=1 Tax=Astathelohania contejeani TaxID=164912 RepID=A0ABQ7HVL2_9MICR|nr:hypothetical protein TCON_2586 [Thelohania contejeani]
MIRRRMKIFLVEISITSQDNLRIVETEKMRKYDFILVNELGLLYKAKAKIISYVMTWDGVLTKYQEITPKIEAYIQATVLKKTVKAISLKYRRSIENDTDVIN